MGTVTGCIQTLRRNIVTRLRRAGITVDRGDVIDHDEQGYFLREWIVVRDGDGRKFPPDVPAGTPMVLANVPAGSPEVPANVPAGTYLNPRQVWVLDQLEQGANIQRVMVERAFDVGEKTAKRDLSELVQRDLIEYLRRGRNGCYRLVKVSRSMG